MTADASLHRLSRQGSRRHAVCQPDERSEQALPAPPARAQRVRRPLQAHAHQPGPPLVSLAATVSPLPRVVGETARLDLCRVPESTAPGTGPGDRSHRAGHPGRLASLRLVEPAVPLPQLQRTQVAEPACTLRLGVGPRSPCYRLTSPPCWSCPGWHREAHVVRPGDLTADHRVPLVFGGGSLPHRLGARRERQRAQGPELAAALSIFDGADDPHDHRLVVRAGRSISNMDERVPQPEGPISLRVVRAGWPTRQQVVRDAVAHHLGR